SSNINGLPESTINITIDGVNVQNNDNKSTDGYFTYVRPRIDAIEEVTVSTATPGAESSGEGAVQIKFVTRSGNNEFHGSIYEYHRDWGLNANYWFNNRDVRPRTDPFDPTKFLDDPKTFKAPRDRLILNQYGFRVGGPFRFPKKLFGPFAFDGRDKAFFFVNYEEYYLPNSINRTRTVLHPRAQQGFIRYIYTDPQTGARSIREVDVLDLARRNNQLATVDPTIAKLLTDIRAATGARGSVEIQEDPNRVTNPIQQRYVFPNFDVERRYFPTTRLDFNLTNKHHLETTYNYQRFGNVALFNGIDPAFPGFPNHGAQHSHRYSSATALRSTLTPTLVNEARFGFSGGPSFVNENVGRDVFTGPLANQAGFNLGASPGTGSTGIAAALGINGATISTTGTRGNTMAYQFNDTLSWTRGAHNLNFGVSFTQISDYGISKASVPTINFGVDANDPAAAMFSAQNASVNFPGAASADITRARNLYGVLTGRVTSIAASANLNEKTNQYEYQGLYTTRARQREMGFFAQDSWRMRPNLTLTLGLRYELEFPFLALNNAYSFTSVDDLFGVSGPGNLFKP
ncbi:MAG: TonB-dependent receptor domain-containing protein, partial [Blastocatellia bacterium]